MIYKLYKERLRRNYQEIEQAFKQFQEIYKKFGVKVIGAWENVDDPQEGYLITAYRDNAHYEETVAKMRTDPKYTELTSELQKVRESIDVTTLKVMPGSPVQ
ncbi:MAG: NIPSNAP family protein [Promethearchaeota archaeon]